MACRSRHRRDQQASLLGLVVRKGINSVADLRGRKLSVSSFGGATYGAAVYLLKNHGLRPKEDIMILPAGTTR